jgi:hypothetical protein
MRVQALRDSTGSSIVPAPYDRRLRAGRRRREPDLGRLHRATDDRGNSGSSPKLYVSLLGQSDAFISYQFNLVISRDCTDPAHPGGPIPDAWRFEAGDARRTPADR